MLRSAWNIPHIFSAVGCADIETKGDAYFERINFNVATYGCRRTGEIWKLNCINNKWKGTYDKCTAGKMTAVHTSSLYHRYMISTSNPLLFFQTLKIFLNYWNAMYYICPNWFLINTFFIFDEVFFECHLKRCHQIDFETSILPSLYLYYFNSNLIIPIIVSFLWINCTHVIFILTYSLVGDDGDASDTIWGAVNSSHGMSIAIIIAVAILVGIVILITGLICLKW